ncbi:MAG: dephospho-CoA kinase [Pseudomonadota bacterium]
MVIIGLTGSIAMGKSTAANALRRMGLPVHDADKVVHELQGPNGDALPAIEKAFPGTTGPDGVDRGRLRQLAYDDPTCLSKLETILHPLVRERERRFLARCARRGEPVVVLDIPLLYETGAEVRCDLVAVVSAPGFIQRARVLRRPGMTVSTLKAILDRQTPDVEKRRRADLVIPTGLSRGHALKSVMRLVTVARNHPGGAWPPNPYRTKGPNRHA